MKIKAELIATITTTKGAVDCCDRDATAADRTTTRAYGHITCALAVSTNGSPDRERDVTDGVHAPRTTHTHTNDFSITTTYY